MEIVIGWLVLVAVLFLSIAVHEAAHFVMMRRYGIRVTNILIGLPPLFKIKWQGINVRFGPLIVYGAVVPDIDQYESSPLGKQFITLMVGPLINLVIGGLLVLLIINTQNAEAFVSLLNYRSPPECSGFSRMALISWYSISSSGFWGIVSLLAAGNLLLGIANYLPIPPLDGGKMFFLILEKVFGNRIKPIFYVVAVMGLLFFAFDTVRILVSDAQIIGSQISTSQSENRPCS